MLAFRMAASMLVAVVALLIFIRIDLVPVEGPFLHSASGASARAATVAPC